MQIGVGEAPIYTDIEKMGTFFLRGAILAVLLAGCTRGRQAAQNGLPAPHIDTVHIAVPVFRVTPIDSAGATQIDSASLALLEQRVMNRVAGILRAQVQAAAGRNTAGIPPAQGGAPQIQPGLLATIIFESDGSLSDSSRTRIAAAAKLLEEVDAPLELRAGSAIGSEQIDVAIARARRVYLDLIALNPALEERDVVFTVTGTNSLYPIDPRVQIFWRAPAPD